MTTWAELVSVGSPLDGVGAHGDVSNFKLDDEANGLVAVRRLNLGAVTLSTVRSTGHRMTAVNAEQVTFFAPLAGTLRVQIGKSEYQATFGGGIFVRPGQRSTRVVPSGGRFFYGVAVSAPVATEAPTDAPPAQAYRDVSHSSAASCLHGFLQYFVREYARPKSILKKQRMLLASEALIDSCLNELNAESGTDVGASLSIMAQRVDDAERLMEAQLADPLTVEELAASLEVSTRALQVAFKSVRGLSPRTALRQMRLDRARQILLAAGRETGVTEIALSCGLEHLGRFSQDYRRRFGESPSATLRRAQSLGERVPGGAAPAKI